jgi:hypothetical protein
MTRRQTNGQLREGTNVYRFQVLLPPDGPVEVRLNDEVGGEALAKAARPVKRGQEVTIEDITAIEKYVPRPEDAGIPHVTAFAHRAGWSIAFEFGYRHPRRHDFLRLGHQFAETAREALAAGRVGVALDNAFSATELLAKTELLSCAPTIEAAIAARTHGSVRESYNLWGRLDNTDRRFIDLLNRLSDLRQPARYLGRELRLKPGEPEHLVELLAEMEAHVDVAVTGDASSALPHSYNVIATRDIVAGQLVWAADFTIRPPKKRQTEGGVGVRRLGPSGPLALLETRHSEGGSV